jgi:hypothetical protein
MVFCTGGCHLSVDAHQVLNQRSFAILLAKTPEKLDEVLADRALVSAGAVARTVAQHQGVRTSA